MIRGLIISPVVKVLSSKNDIDDIDIFNFVKSIQDLHPLKGKVRDLASD